MLRGRVIWSVSPTHCEPIPLDCRPFELDATRRGACHGHVHDADPQVTALFRKRAGDNGTYGTSGMVGTRLLSGLRYWLSGVVGVCGWEAVGNGDVFAHGCGGFDASVGG